MKRSRKVESKEHAALTQEFEDLENFWKSVEKFRPRKDCLEISSSCIIAASSHRLFQTSPRTLMSSLQHKRPRPLMLNNCSNAVEEILMDRRAAISSGRFKGRQLFVEEKTVVEVAGERGGDGRRKEKGGGGCMIATACLAILLFVVALVFLYMSCSEEEFILVPT